jgi:enamine deaminase RidA (YjgF/YER057c/UK114 family)
MPKPHGYSQVIEFTGNVRMVFVSGQVAEDADGNIVGKGDIVEQVHQAFRNIQIAIEEAGGKLEHIVKLNSYLKNISQISEVRKIRDVYINTDKPPVSTTVQVVLDDPELLVEIDAIAIIPLNNLI